MKTLLIDGDGLAWRSAFIAAGGNARGIASGMVRRLQRSFDGARAIIGRSDQSRTYFRHGLFPGYKPARSDPPENIGSAWAGLADAGPIVERPGLEADDVLGILATTEKAEYGIRIIVADDKDLLTIPGLHHRPGKMQPGQTLTVGRAEAETRHLLQTLTGDSGDGYPGCPRIGTERANKIVDLFAYIDSPLRVWHSVVDAFIKAGLGPADAILQARIARIVRSSDFDYEDRQVIPWQPPTESYRVGAVELPPAAAPAEPVPSSLFGDDTGKAGASTAGGFRS